MILIKIDFNIGEAVYFDDREWHINILFKLYVKMRYILLCKFTTKSISE